MNFLLICHQYPPDIDASSNIIRHLAETFRKKGHTVDVITQGDYFGEEQYNGVHIYKVKKSKWEIINQTWSNKNSGYRAALKIISYLRKIMCALKIKEYPNVEPYVTKKMIKIYQCKCIDKTYDCIIGFFRPFFCLDVAMNISKYCCTKFVPIYFDLIEDKDCPKLMPRHLFKKKILIGDKKIFENAQKIFLPVSAKDIEYNIFKNNHEKIVYYNFPTFIKKERNFLSNVEQKKKDMITFTYAGTLKLAFRNPLKLLDVLNELAKKNKETKIVLHLYGAGDCEKLIENFECENNFVIIQHGIVSKIKADEGLLNTDFLINITNEYNAIVPSKIFELFALGKPIVNIVNKDDGSLTFFEKYQLNYNICYNNDVEKKKCVDNLWTFIQKTRGKILDYNTLYSTYFECTPEYMCQQIIKALEE